MEQLNFIEKTNNEIIQPEKKASYINRYHLDDKFNKLLHEELGLATLVSYIGNKNVPLLRIYRYKEAFALSFVEEFFSRFDLNEKDYIFDPFCGMGTTLFAASKRGISSLGVDRLPVAVFVAKTLPLFFSMTPGKIKEKFELMRRKYQKATPASVAMDVAIMKIAFPSDILLEMRKWKTVIDDLESPLKDIFLLLFFSILETCSFTSKDGQFLRLVREKKVPSPEEAIERKVYEVETDLQSIKKLKWVGLHQVPSVYLGDARDLTNIKFIQKTTAIITSPLYPNRYDYTRTYSLELCFHFIRTFEEMKALRNSILRSHIESKVDSSEKPQHPAVQEVVNSLRKKGKELNNPRIPDLLIGYFIDMGKVIKEWSRVLEAGARVAMVVDNVRFEGELIPVDFILSEMAEQEGFKIDEIIVARYKGNSSQQMGKFGRIPVRESVVVWTKR